MTESTIELDKKPTKMTERLGEYLEAVERIYKENGVVHLKDLADELIVEKSSVHFALRRLVSLGKVRANIYGSNLTSYEPVSAPTHKQIQRLLSELRQRMPELPDWLKGFSDVFNG